MTQSESLEILKTGRNVFLTGPAGSGKTYLLSKYVDFLKKNGIKTAVTASTGIAATHLNGRTIHSWCGMGIREHLDRRQLDDLRENDKVAERVKTTEVLIIDEISMLNADRLDLVNNICQAIRQNLRPFGGLQVILCGDFFQLPPVTRREEEDGRFVVDSGVWQDMDLQICYLEEQYRQEDQDFLHVLAAIRHNAVSQDIAAILLDRLNRPLSWPIKPTKLYTHNRDVDTENLFELSRLVGEERVYKMSGQGAAALVKSLKESYCLAPEILSLKPKALVMFVRNNFSKGYVNGTLGTVVDFDQENGYPIVETMAGKLIVASPETWAIEDGNHILAAVSQIPLRLAWAITVHKSQGMSLDGAEIDLSRTFEFGMGYVALSRVRTLGGIRLLGINDLAWQVNQKAIVLDEWLIKKSQQDLLKNKKLGIKQIKKDQADFLKGNKRANKHKTLF